MKVVKIGISRTGFVLSVVVLTIGLWGMFSTLFFSKIGGYALIIPVSYVYNLLGIPKNPSDNGANMFFGLIISVVSTYIVFAILEIVINHFRKK